MAKLCAHGSKFGEFDFLGYRIAHMSDGKILRNSGAGWKRYKKVKPQFSPFAAYIAAKERFEKLLAENPAYREYRELLLKITGSLEARVHVHCIISMLGNDIDGCWAELNDYGDSYSLEDVKDLCDAYASMMREKKERLLVNRSLKCPHNPHNLSYKVLG